MLKHFSIVGAVIGITLVLGAAMSSSASADCLKVDTAGTGKYETNTCLATRPGTAFILAFLRSEILFELYCAEVFVPETGRFRTLFQCELDDPSMEAAKGLFIWIKAAAGLTPVPLIFTALSGEGYPLNLGGSLKGTSELRSEAGTLSAKEFSVLLHVAELTSLGTATIELLGVEEPKEKAKCNTAGDSEANGAVLVPNAEFHLVYSSLSPFELAALILFTKYTITCNLGALESTITGPATARIVTPTPEAGKGEDNTSLQLASKCANKTTDLQEIPAYYNSSLELVPTTLLANIAGTGTKKACELIEGTTLLVPETGSAASMFAITH
jgi:hypothetical protein